MASISQAVGTVHRTTVEVANIPPCTGRLLQKPLRLLRRTALVAVLLLRGALRPSGATASSPDLCIPRMALKVSHNCSERPPSFPGLALAGVRGDPGVRPLSQDVAELRVSSSPQGRDSVGDDRNVHLLRCAIADRAHIDVVAALAEVKLHAGLAHVRLADRAEPDLAGVINLHELQHLPTNVALAMQDCLTPAFGRQRGERSRLVLDILKGSNAFIDEVHVLGQETQEERSKHQ